MGSTAVEKNVMETPMSAYILGKEEKFSGIDVIIYIYVYSVLSPYTIFRSLMGQLAIKYNIEL